MSQNKRFDLCVIGGGINGAGIAADAAGRGLSVCLFEKGDLGAGTSSASSKLIHGGLRYLEHREFKLVREALHEREILLRAAPHIIWPLRFVLPHVDSMRPRWMLRAGLFLYDRLAGRSSLPNSTAISFARDVVGPYLRADITRGFSYWDCWVDDARLVILNAQSAAGNNALICPGTEVTGFAHRRDHDGVPHWQIETRTENGKTDKISARALVNAAGPWVGQVAALQTGETDRSGLSQTVRLVKGSHIVVPRTRGLDEAVLLQHRDGRVVFVLPYGNAFTLIGTTDEPFYGDPTDVSCSDEERDYLLALVNRYFVRQLSPDDICHRFAGVRPLFDDARADPSKVTRDYRLVLDATDARPPLLTVLGGKITTYRRLGEDAVNELKPFFPHQRAAWTSHQRLPGGDLGPTFAEFVRKLRADYGGFDPEWISQLARRYGTATYTLLGDAKTQDDLGKAITAELSEREVCYLRDQEWARKADDILWRRSKTGLHVASEDRNRVASEIEQILSPK